MDSNLLKIFVAVAGERSVTLGAKKLKQAQSNITARIKQLENDLGFKLFHRVPQGVLLTKEGEMLYPRACEIVSKIERLNKEIKKSKELSLRVVSTEANAAVRVVPFLLRLYNDFKGASLELTTNTTAGCLKWLLDYKADIAFVSGIVEHKDLMTLNIFDETMVIASPKQTSENAVFLAYRKGCAYNDFAMKYLQSRKIEAKIFEFASYETILGCVEAGIGQTILPLSIIEKLGYDKKLNLKILSKKQANIPTTMICRKDNVPNIEQYLRDMKL
ncbi:LysR family transcriptional regulator [Campylobacter sp. JMF_01 NE2]|uniref:LysR family transcriptional regulator n=1 Tax=unclassified Campylobacter TaxID=2593542 RepID=UPI0022E9D8D9|nr:MULTISPECIES: LysR family transcriptional regulator [unclassified Campylobacter]MDA3051996.1 LysR family transcriptional regulator [Campylobacter sp. JMF_03 NE3]MDA3066330.1 LysR family transcriptional regulator [Campylobacter sp. JMF_01 NE2]